MLYKLQVPSSRGSPKAILSASNIIASLYPSVSGDGPQAEQRASSQWGARVVMWRVSARASAAPTPSIRYLVTPHLHIPQFRSCVGWSLSVAHTIVLCSHHYPLGLPSWGWWMASPRHLSPPALLAGSPPSSPAHSLLGTVACVHRARGSPALALLWPTWLAPFFSRQPLRSAPLGGRGPLQCLLPV